MNNEKWNGICFLLSEDIKSDISENQFEQSVIQALMVLGWQKYLGDFEIRSSLQIGAANRITPDFIVKSSDGRKLFVIEIKQPSIPITSNFQQQLFSYMRQLKLEYGILVGQSIQVFYDGDSVEQEDPILLETIRFERNSAKGEEFVQLFSKEKFNVESLKEFSLNAIKKLNRKKERKNLKSEILSDDYKHKLFELIKQSFIRSYDGEMIDDVLKELDIKITDKNKSATDLNQKDTSVHNNGETLPITLNPSDNDEFKKKLVSTKKAYIKIVYENGKEEKETWEAKKFKESSGVIGNLRSKSKFRQGEWQRLGIKEIFVSIENE